MGRSTVTITHPSLRGDFKQSHKRRNNAGTILDWANATGGGRRESEEEEGEEGPSGSGSLLLTDPDVLDCPICLEHLISPVFQCNNGHVACSSCCIKLGNKCPSCSMPIGYNRCRAIEKRYLILQEQTDDRIVVLSNEAEPLGIALSVVCIGPSPAKRECAYYLTARKEDSSVRLQSFAESVPQWVECCPLKKFLLVPSDFIGSSGKLKLELCIWEA
ncbi:hypothetical protein Vadar_003322 [Vaccinium darrowii]|uniref:Uncharacterized protein n=1 Tax=Vaccinium darrowii TaxID=229202 RepID=A0ACB7XWS4_9ERIC|nr:hypothetical protein Vadar_003322 [Vaccinium darrowii]